MRQVLIFISVICLSVGFSINTQAQLVAKADVEVLIPGPSFNISNVGAGAGLLMSYFNNRKTGFGLQASANHFFLKKTFSNRTYQLLSIHADGRQYISGDVRNGGFFGFGQIGVTTARTGTNEVSINDPRPSFAAGAGFTLNTRLCFSLKYHLVFIQNQSNLSFTGIRFGYVLSN